MGTGQRIALLGAAVVVLAVAIVVSRGSDDEGEGESVRHTQEQVEDGATDDGTVTAEGTGGATAPAGETQEQPPPPRVETVRIRGGGPVGQPQTLSFDSGDTVRLRFRSDRAAEVHIHGYERTVTVPSGGSARTRFKATAEGIFEVEEHHSGELLAELRVQP